MFKLIKIKYFILSALVLFGVNSFATVNIEQKIQQIKNNIRVSDKNKSQYEQSYKTSLANLDTIKKSLANLENVKKLALQDKNSIQQNEKKYLKLMQEYKNFMSEEKTYLDQEEKLAESLKNQLKQLYGNIAKRKANMRAYDKVIAEAGQRSQVWKKKSRDVASVVAQAQGTQKELVEQGNEWAKKQKIYKTEMEKWNRQKKTSEVNLKLIQAL